MTVAQQHAFGPTADILDRLDKVKAHDGYWTARCPAHQDRNPSLSITEGTDGRVLLNCHSGCTTEQIVSALGITAADLFPERDETQQRREVAVYRYEDETGVHLFDVVRFQPKTFRQRRPDGTWGLGDTQRVLYRLPEVRAAIDRGDPVYIVEGEKDADAIVDAGAVATCNPMGAGKWRDDYTAQLHGLRQAIIVADNDDPGIQHAQHVANALEQAGITARIVMPATGKDAADHIYAGNSLDELVPRIPPATAPTDKFTLVVRTAVEIEATPDPPATDVLLGPFITRGERTIIVGDTGHGKTTLSLQMLGAVLTGTTAIGHHGAAEGPIMIVDLEQGRKAIKRGLREAGLHQRTDVLHISVPDGLALDRDEEHIAELERVIAEHKPVALLLDPYYKAHRADDSNQERPIVDLMRQLDGLRTRHGFALLLPAHPRKDLVGREGARKLTLHDVAGSGAVTRGAEIVLGVERLAHGYARLRYLKDREGELPIGEHMSLLYDKQDGFRIDHREDETDEAIEQRILATESPWRTVDEWRKDLEIRKTKCSEILAKLAESNRIACMTGPPGRSSKARCYGTSPECWEQSGLVGTQDEIPIESVTGPTVPPPVRGTEWDQSNDATGPAASELDVYDPDVQALLSDDEYP